MVTDASVLHEPMARAALLRGVKAMVRTLRPTLGPGGGTVAIASISPLSPPEVLGDGATIAKRTVALDGRFRNIGAMVIRDLVERVDGAVGDGSATAAVIAGSLLEAAVRYLSAGGDVVAVKRGLHRALAEAQEELREQARIVDSTAELSRMMAHQVGDQGLATMIAEVLEAVGPSGTVLFRDSERVETTHEYAEGMRWNAGIFSSLLLDPETTTGQAIEPRILVTDHVLADAGDLLPAVDACVRGGCRSLVVIAPEIRESALGLLIINKQRGVLDAVLAVKAPSRGGQQLAALEDIAAVTGARSFRRKLGEHPKNANLGDLGAARQVWASQTAAGIVGGRGDRGAIQERLHAARTDLRTALDEDSRAEARERIGNLTGLTAIIRVGGQTKNQRASLRLRIESAVTSGRLATQDGVVPGGGAALLACLPSIEALPLADDEKLGAGMLMQALHEPIRTILHNAGLEPSAILAQADQRERSYTYDVLSRQWVSAWDGGIVDPLPVLSTALQAAVSAVSTVISTDVLISRNHEAAFATLKVRAKG